MDNLSAPGSPFDGLSALCRPFARRARAETSRPRLTAYAEVAAARAAAAVTESHRRLAIEQTKAALDHYLEVSQRWSEARRRQEEFRRSQEAAGPYGKSQVARDEEAAWVRWLGVIEEALRGAEAAALVAVRAWVETGRPAGGGAGETAAEQGVIHRGRLYLAAPRGEGDELRLVIVDLGASQNLDGSLAVVDLVTADRSQGTRGLTPSM